MTKVGIIGAGAWGAALATVAARNNHPTVVWDVNLDIAKTINSTHKHPFALTDIPLDSLITGTTDIDQVCGCPLILAAVPSQFMRSALAPLRNRIQTPSIVTLCAKGIEKDSSQLMSEVAKDTIPGIPTVILSGPTFSTEVASGLPTAITLAADDANNASYVAQILGSESFRPYLSDDPIGAQISGAAKNVLAIACGIAEGKSLGQNAIAALITRGITEIDRLSTAMGGSGRSMMEPAGVGDIVLTCTSSQSRNFSFGRSIGQEKSSITSLVDSSGTVEGFATAASISQLSRRHSVEMPIMEAVSAVLHRQAGIDDTISGLLTRSLERPPTQRSTE